MRRWFAILMIAMLPLQWSWAAMAVYCGHEAGQRAQHLGHHAHQHASTSQDGAAADPAAAGVADLDCGHCHATNVGMPSATAGMVAGNLAARPLAPADGALRTRAASPPERPQWLPLA